MPVLTNLAQAEVRRGVTKIFGETLTSPTLMLGDGVSITWCVDVMVSELDPTGKINQYKKNKKGPPSVITGLPGQPPEDWQLDDSLPGAIDATLRNVPLARNNYDLVYAAKGSAVVLERDASGQFVVTGFTIEVPGTHVLYPVDLGNLSINTVIDLTVEQRTLTFHEIGHLQPFGRLPLGASAIYQGGVMIRIVS